MGHHTKVCPLDIISIIRAGALVTLGRLEDNRINIYTYIHIRISKYTVQTRVHVCGQYGQICGQQKLGYWQTILLMVVSGVIE